MIAWGYACAYPLSFSRDSLPYISQWIDGHTKGPLSISSGLRIKAYVLDCLCFLLHQIIPSSMDIFLTISDAGTYLYGHLERTFFPPALNDCIIRLGVIRNDSAHILQSVNLPAFDHFPDQLHPLLTP